MLYERDPHGATQSEPLPDDDALLVRRTSAFVAFLALFLGLTPLVAAEQARASDTVTRWEHFSESSECSDPYTKTPYMPRSGYLGDSRAILGPFGTYFGRTIEEVRDRQVTWVVPYSGGQTIKVHKAALPAFQRVAESLEEHAEWGRIYWISSVGGFYPRTISGSYQLSRHGLGIAIDINPSQNPHRSDKLVTNMPTWFVDAWRDAGFCWGGDWKYSKDAMHFSWIGPGSDPGYAAINPIPPRTTKRSFGAPVDTTSTVFAPVTDRYALMLGDATGNAAPDVVGLRPHPDGAVMDIASSTRYYDYCSVERWFIPDSSVLGGDEYMLADTNGDSRQDLVALSIGGSSVSATVATRRGDFEDVLTRGTGLPTDLVASTAADFNGDHIADIWAVSSDGSLRVYAGPDWTQTIHSSVLPSGAPHRIAAGDRDAGDVPELFAIYDAGSARVEVLSLDGTWSIAQSLLLAGPAPDFEVIAAYDFDGDGRSDFETLEEDGQMTAYVGNTPTGRGATSWFVRPDPDCEDRIPLDFEGRFFDDDQSVHQNGIEFIAVKGITVGCNPPFNDMFCPTDTLTRAQAATFVARAFGLPLSSTDYFTDDSGHVLEGAINRVAEAGITQGCNPPANTRFCPQRGMTRAEFAGFLARALSLPASNVDYFTDDDGHILEGAINRLAAAGITQGCNPPENDRFCPSDRLTRAEAATFFKRALG